MRYRFSRWLLVAALLSLGALALFGPGCDANGSTQGGTQVIADPCSAGNLSPTWTTLYNCYFGPTGKAGCSGKTSCHGAPPPCTPTPGPNGCLSGTIIWNCGPTKESCWQGMTVAQCFCPDAGSSTGTSDAATESGPFDAAAESSATDAESSVDAGAESAAASACPQTCMSLAPPVPPGSASDPTTTPLWFALRGASGPGQHDMPYTPSSFVFSQQDLDLISTWIKQGAQDN